MLERGGGSREDDRLKSPVLLRLEEKRGAHLGWPPGEKKTQLGIIFQIEKERRTLRTLKKDCTLCR